MDGRMAGHDAETGDNLGLEMPPHDFSSGHDMEVLLNSEFQALTIEVL